MYKSKGSTAVMITGLPVQKYSGNLVGNKWYVSLQGGLNKTKQSAELSHASLSSEETKSVKIIFLLFFIFLFIFI